MAGTEVTGVHLLVFSPNRLSSQCLRLPPGRVRRVLLARLSLHLLHDLSEPEPTTQSLRTVDWIGTHKRPCQLSREPRSAYITVLDIELVSWLTGICWKDSPDSSFKSLPTVGLGIGDCQGQRMRALK